MTATLKNDVGPEDFGISTMDAEKARHYAAFLVAAERERCAKLVQNMDTTGHDGYIETAGDLCEALAACIRRA